MAFFTVLVAVALFLWFFKICSPNPRLREYGDRLPGPKPLPVIGNGLVFMTSKTMVRALDELCTTYGPVLRLWLGSKLWICLSDPADIAVFLFSNKHLNKSDIYRLLDGWLGTKGLVTSNADIWRIHRKLLTPSFHFKMVEDSIPILQRNANILCEKLEFHLNQSEFDITGYMEKCSFDIICEMAMGLKLEKQVSSEVPYLDSLTMVKNSAINRLFKAWLHPEYIFKQTKCGKIYYEQLRIIKKEIEKVILQRREELLSKKASSTTSTLNGKKKIKPFLDFMLSESNFTDEEIENEVQTFMFAGQDTTMTTMSFCIYLLSQHHNIQNKCVEEICNALSNKNELSYQDYANLKYLENVLRETLRMYTTVPLISRQVEEDVVLPSGYVLPAGSLVNFNLLHMHNNEKYFPNPETFDPMRFETKTDNDKQVNAFLPFSAGPRNCIGRRFAMLEMKVVLSTLLLKYEILPTEWKKPLTVETKIVLESVDGILVRLRPRNV